jgi:hypothetical protein
MSDEAVTCEQIIAAAGPQAPEVLKKPRKPRAKRIPPARKARISAPFSILKLEDNGLISVHRPAAGTTYEAVQKQLLDCDAGKYIIARIYGEPKTVVAETVIKKRME